MKHKFHPAFLAVVMLAAGSAAFAQDPPPPQGPPPGGEFERRGPGRPVGFGPDTFAFRGMDGGFGAKTVTGAAFSATIVMEHKNTLSDGNTLERKTTGLIARDSSGRTRREMALPSIGPLRASGEAPQLAFISDPVAQKNYVLDAGRKTVEEFPVRKPGEGFIEPHGGRRGGPGGEGPPKFAQREHTPPVTESLGTRTIDGLAVQGTRSTRTIPAGEFGNANPIVITVERWYSPDLQVTVSETMNDPRFGVSTYQLTGITRGEPDVTLFAVPAGYTAAQRPQMRRGPRPAPPQAPQE